MRITMITIGSTGDVRPYIILGRELKARGIRALKVVCSDEKPLVPGGRTPGSVSFVPPAAGLAMAGAVIRDLTAKRQEDIGK